MNNVATEYPITAYACQVTSVSSLTANTFLIDLQTPANTTLGYHAGQYLKLELDLNNDGQRQSLFYSIANGFNPAQPRQLQLLIHNSSEFAGKVLKHLTEQAKRNTSISVTLPMGHAFLQTDLNLPHLLIAAGSGISKIKCISEAILRQNPDALVKIYWSNKHAHEFYLLDEFQECKKQYKHLEFTPILETADENWKGRSGYIYEIVEKDYKNLSAVQTYLCGSPNMVYGTIDKLNHKGLVEKNCYSDVFEFSPREQKIAI